MSELRRVIEVEYKEARFAIMHCIAFDNEEQYTEWFEERPQFEVLKKKWETVDPNRKYHAD